MTRAGICMLAAMCLLSLGCDDDQPPVDRTGNVINVPLDASFAEAIAMAAVNDTILVSAQVALERTIMVQSDQTPFVIAGGKVASILSPGANQTAIIFQEPKAGMYLSDLLITTPDGMNEGTGIAIQGGATLTIENCTFQGFAVQVAVTGGILNLNRNLMRNPSLFSVDALGSAEVSATRNTLTGAGDCAIRLGGTTTLSAQNNILVEYLNYGIACTGSSRLIAPSGCNDLFDSDDSGLPYLFCVPPESDFFLDPLFCDPLNANYTLRPDSPCWERDTCGTVGNFGVGCAPESN